MSLIKSKSRVSEHGEVFTPDHIVDAMHDLLKPEKGKKKTLWHDPSMIYLEPTCGNGQFVVKAVEKKIASGLSPEDACNTVFGMDIMCDNVNECRLRVLGAVQSWLEKHAMLFVDDRMERIRCIVLNNIFKVKDSLEYIQSGKWDKRKFFDEDPTESGDQVLSEAEQDDLRNKAKEWSHTHE